MAIHRRVTNLSARVRSSTGSWYLCAIDLQRRIIVSARIT